MTFYLAAGCRDTNDIWWHYCSLFKCFNFKRAGLNYQPEHRPGVSDDGLPQKLGCSLHQACFVAATTSTRTQNWCGWLKAGEWYWRWHPPTRASHPRRRVSPLGSSVGVPSPSRVAPWWHHLWLSLSQLCSLLTPWGDTPVNGRWKLCVLSAGWTETHTRTRIFSKKHRVGPNIAICQYWGSSVDAVLRSFGINES